MLSASKLTLATHCAGAFTLPQTDETNRYQEEGNERDAEFTRRINAGDIPEALANQWPNAKWRTQVRFAYNFDADTGRELASGEHRDYSDVSPAEICGTADAVGEMPGLVIVVDFKSFDPNVPRAAVNPQIHIAALALCRVRGIERADVAIHHEARAFDVAALYGMDLDAFAGDAKRIAMAVRDARDASANGAAVVFTAGYWCRWCNAFNDCPKQAELKALVFTGAASQQIETKMPLVNDEDAADAYELWKRIGILQKRLSDALHARAAERPIPLHSGKLFSKLITDGKRTLDGDKTYEIMRTKYGQEIADKAVAREATQSGIKKALEDAGQKGVDGKVKEIVAELEKTDGVTRKPSVKFEEIDAKQLKAAG